MVDVGDDKGAKKVALLHDCLALVPSESNCVLFVLIRGNLGELGAQNFYF